MFLAIVSLVYGIVPLPPFQCKDYCGFNCSYYKLNPCTLSNTKQIGFNPKSSLQTQFPAIDQYSICPSDQTSHQLSSSFQTIYINSVCSSDISTSVITKSLRLVLVSDTVVQGSGQKLSGDCPMLNIYTNDFDLSINNLTIDCKNSEPALYFETRRQIDLTITNAASNTALLSFDGAQTARCKAENITAPTLLTTDVGTGTFECTNVPHRIVFTSLINDVVCINCNCLDIANMTDARYIETILATDTDYLFSVKILAFRIMVVSLVVYFLTLNVLVDK